jgi:hypothetical protein
MKKLYSLPVFFLFLGSCMAPRVVTKITPEAPEGHYAMGREYISLHSDRIEVELGYDGRQDGDLVFDFVVYNTTSDTLTIKPEDFYYVILDSTNAEPVPDSTWMALHAGKVMVHYDEAMENRKKEKGKNSFFGVLQAGVGILYNTTAFIATEDPGYLADALLHTVGTADQFISQDRMIREEMEMISEEKGLVQAEIFRVCEVPPGEAKNGYVYFPSHDKTGYYMFCFPIKDQLFQFVYKQQKELRYY